VGRKTGQTDLGVHKKARPFREAVTPAANKLQGHHHLEKGADRGNPTVNLHIRSSRKTDDRRP
jgi:hypothetical protein